MRVAEATTLDDFHSFYVDGRWVVQVVRKLVEIFTGLQKELQPNGKGMSTYMINKPKIDEELGYLSQADVKGFSCAEANQTMKAYVAQMDKAYAAWNSGDKENPDKLAAAKSEYTGAVTQGLEYLKSFESSCTNIVRNHFVNDEGEVSSILNEIRDSGNYVMNGK